MTKNPIDKKSTSDFPSLLPYGDNVGAPVIKPVDKGKVKGRAMSAMNQQVDVQMNQLLEQMQLLAEQAKKLQSRVEISNRIYDAEINFQPLISHVYHLYRNEETGAHVMSMIGPTEWGRSKKIGIFVASVKLLADHTWDILSGNSDEI